MIEVIRYNSEKLIFQRTTLGKIMRKWEQDGLTRIWTSASVATVYPKRVVLSRDLGPVEMHYINQYPAARIRNYDRWENLLYNDRERYFLGRSMHICPAERAFFPFELPEILDYVEQRWGWNVDVKVRDLLVQARS